MKGFKKIGILFLALVIALAGIGVGYAAWTDTITIEGTVNTGTVDLEVVGYSGTWVWKVPGKAEGPYGSEIVVLHRPDVAPNPMSNPLLIASSWAEAGAGGVDDPDVEMYWDNLFPSIVFYADVVLHYNGSIPVKVNYIDWDFWQTDGGNDWLAALEASGDAGATLTLVSTGDGRPILNDGVVIVGTQLHQSDIIKLEVWIHIPQEWPDGTMTTDLMDRSAAGYLDIEVVQWNEFPD